MKKILKDQKGINLISLSLTVMIILILTSMIIYNVKDNLRLEKLRNMQADIENLRDKVSSYYSQYGEIPADITVEYENIQKLRDAGLISQAVDIGDFYVVDLSAMENVTLNYGKDYKKIQNGEVTSAEDINELTDLYIINEVSHNIFYVKGVEIDGEKFYTDYTKDDVDQAIVDMRYVNNVEIPEGYTYIKGSVDYVITIQSNSDPDKVLTWISVEEELTEVPYDIQIEADEEASFLESANLFKGYYKNMQDDTVIYLTVRDKWSPTYDKTATYKDTNEDTAVIPKGFQVSERQGETLISEGLVVKGPDGSEFVWVPVEDINDMAQCETAGGECDLQIVDGTLKCTNEAHSDTAEKIVGKLWATTTGENFGTENTTYNPNDGLREPAIITGNADGTGTDYDNNKSYNNGLFTLESLKSDYKEMATSVAKNKGFYIGRYETSLEGATATTLGNGNVQSKPNVLPTSAGDTETYMWYGLYKKQNKTYTGTDNSVQSSMIWGSQYDAMLNWVKNRNSADKDKITENTNGNHSGSVVTTGNSSYSKDSINNIKDLEGNLREWTLETDDTNIRVLRGGCYAVNSSPSYRDRSNPHYNGSNIGSRLALYIK